MRRRVPCQRLALAAALLMASGVARAAEDPLLFPKDKFTEQTITVQSAGGEKKVVVRAYEHLPYVAKPVDIKYESLDVRVPISIDGKPVDASKSPIIFYVNIGGYMSSANIRDASAGRGGPGRPPGDLAGRGGQAGGPPADLAGRGGQGGRGMGGPPGGGRGMGRPAGGGNNALAFGYVTVTPGARGRDNQAADGTYYGKAPAAIVDLKAAVRYIRHNKGILPGNVEQIVATGCSAGGGLTSILGASGNSPLYEPFLKEIGAADEKDNIFAADCRSPIADLDHADLSYEWQYGASKTNNPIDAKISGELKKLFAAYEASLNLKGRNNFGTLTAANLGEYLVKYYFQPEATKYLLGLTEDQRQEYLTRNASWLKWDGKTTIFTMDDFAAQHITRMKPAPAFDRMNSPETSLFGDKTTNARHFTDYMAQTTTGNPNTTVDAELKAIVNLMNPLYFIQRKNPDVAQQWRIRQGGTETDASAVVAVNLATALENMGRGVDAAIYWDAGHCQDLDPAGFLVWVAQITGSKLP